MTPQIVALQAMAKHLDQVQPIDFDIGCWETCAIGHCRDLPELRAIGFEFDKVQADFPSQASIYLARIFGMEQAEIAMVFTWLGYMNQRGTFVDVQPSDVAKMLRRVAADLTAQAGQAQAAGPWRRAA